MPVHKPKPMCPLIHVNALVSRSIADYLKFTHGREYFKQIPLFESDYDCPPNRERRCSAGGGGVLGMFSSFKYPTWKCVYYRTAGEDGRGGGGGGGGSGGGVEDDGPNV